MSNLIGQTLGRYQILEQLGEGGMASVYKAFDTRLERNVAVKVILPSREQDEKFLKRFELEARALAGLSHPNIVKVLDYGDHDGIPYLIMEFIFGGTLKKMLGQPIPWGEAAGLLAPIARALEYAHQQKIVHRDVKPANILLTQSGEPMLSDFGIAKILESGETLGLTGTGTAIGTPEYMAPEQVLGDPVDHRADIYALGVVFYELVTGRSPYRADTPVAVMLKKTTDPLPRPSQFVPNLPDSVEGVLLKALAKEPRNRYQDMESFAKALEQIATDQLWEKTRMAAVQTKPAEATPKFPPPSPAVAVPKPPRKRGWIFWLVGGIVLTVLCLSAVIVMAVNAFSGKGPFGFLFQGPVSTQPVIVSPTQAPTQLATSSSQSNVLFYDDFSNPNTGWSTRNDGDIMEYSSGGYRMYVSETMTDLIANPGQWFQTDVIIDVDATKIGGADDNDFGVICRMQDLNNFYFFQVSSDGYAVIGEYVDNKMSYLSADSMQAVDGLLAGNANNHIRAECIGSNLVLYANGNLVASVTDNTYSSGGDAGLMAGTFNEAGVDILFDNFFVTRP